MSYPYGPVQTLAPSIMRFLQFAQRKKMAQMPPPEKMMSPEGNLPGELPLSQQITLPGVATQAPSVPPATSPAVPLAQPADSVGREPAPRIISAMQGPAAPILADPPRPLPLDLPVRQYDMPDVVEAPQLQAPPQRDVAGENRRAYKSALLPAGLGLLLGGAEGAVAAAGGAIAGSRARAEREANAETQAWQTNRQAELQQYGLDRQEASDKTARLVQKMRGDQARDANLTAAKRAEWEAWNKEMDRLAKARSTPDASKVVPALLTHRAKTAELMSTQPEEAQIRVASDFNAIATGLGRPDLAFSIPESGPVFAMQPKDTLRGAMTSNTQAKTAQVPVLAGNTVKETEAEIKDREADNKRADRALGLDAWYKGRQVEISQGRLNLVQEKAKLDKDSKNVKTWDEAQMKIADLMAKAARLKQGGTNPVTGKQLPPSESALTAASIYEGSAKSLATRFGKTWEDATAQSTSTATAPSSSPYVNPGPIAPVFMPPNSSGVRQVGANPNYRPPSRPVTGSAGPVKRSATPAPKATPGPKTTAKPAPTPRPSFLTKDPKTLTNTEKAALRAYLRKGMGLK